MPDARQTGALTMLRADFCWPLPKVNFGPSPQTSMSRPNSFTATSWSFAMAGTPPTLRVAP
eukprot:13754516-Alexandrium_andersonii.AAC.1